VWEGEQVFAQAAITIYSISDSKLRPLPISAQCPDLLMTA
jgi:hypothetical protein